MNNSSSSDLPAVRLASGVEPQQKWPMSNESENDGSKPGNTTTSTNRPKLIELSPTQGDEGTIITVVVQALPPQMPAKLAFNSLMVDTKQMEAQGITSLVATVPPFQQTHSATPNVPVSICFLDKDMVTETWLVVDFNYNNSEKDKKKTTATTSPFNVNNSSNINDTFQPKDNNDFLNSSAAAYQKFYSSPAVNSPYGFGAQVPSYQQYSYQQQQPSTQQHRDIFEDKYNQPGPSNQHHQQYNGYSSPALNLFPTAGTGGFTSMLTSGLDQTATTTAPSTIMSPLTSSYALQPQPQPTRSHQKHTNRQSHNSGGAVYGFKSAAHTPTASVANYQPYPGLVSRANLDIMGDLDAMAKSWSTEEWDHRRRLVQFWREQHGNKITCSFQPVPQGERVSNSNNIVVSCIYWMERNDFFITSVDCIYLLECLMDIRFSVEEKNRIRRNLEGFRPLTVSKCKAESAEFFKLIISFPNPKPRNIEKDVKVFPWKTLPYALKKIVTKYTASSYNSAGSNSNSNQQKVNTANQQINNSSSNISNAAPVTPTVSSPTTPNSNTNGVRSTVDPTFYQPERSPLSNDYQQQQASYTHDLYEQQGYYNQQQQNQSTLNDPNSNNEPTSSNSIVSSLNDLVNNNNNTNTTTPPNTTTTASIKNEIDETNIASPSLSEHKSTNSN